MSQFPTIFCRFFLSWGLVLGLCALAAGQNDSIPANNDRFEISLLTCGPGTDLYSLFGHSALHVKDRMTGQDIVYNYGIFDFDEPGFMWKFLRGKLLYKLGKSRLAHFLYAYEREGRSVVSNKLLLSPEQEVALLAALEENYKPENRYYLYDFYYDNCATRIRDILEDHITTIETGADPAYRSMSYRRTLDLYTDPHYPWTDLGMDVILGRPTDIRCDARGAMYLPDYLQSNLKQYKINGSPLLGPDVAVLEQKITAKNYWLLHPLFILGVCTLIFGFFSKRYTKRRIWNIIDPVLLGIFSIMGCIMLFMHIGTDHTATNWNFNILWAFPLLWIAWFYKNNSKWWRIFLVIYLIGAFISMFAQGGFWGISLVQFIPIIIAYRRGWLVNNS